MPATLLVVDDDEDLRGLIVLALKEAGFRTVEAANGRSAIEKYHAHQPDLVVLDIGLGAMDGLEVCRRLRAAGNVPIVFLTSRADEIDQLVGFAVGGDDYITKPVSPRLLVARVGSVLRRGAAEPDTKTKFTAGPISLDLEAREVLVNGQRVELTRTEFGVLAVLIENPKRVTSREDLIARVWGTWYGDDHIVEVHLSRLRRKITEAGGPRVVVAVRGVGYKLGLE
ncbi:MAG: response regulator transcription factor [Candidatus Nanopelagicales bacterium]